MNNTQKKQRVVFVLLGAYPLFFPGEKLAYGGAEMDLYTIAKNLDKKTFDVHFVVGDFGQKNISIIDEITVHKGPKIKNTKLTEGIANLLKLFSLISKIKPDVIFSKGINFQTIELIGIKIFLHAKLVLKSSHRRNIDGSLNRSFSGICFKVLLNQIDSFILQNFEDEEIFRKTFPKYKNHLTIIRNSQEIPPYKNRLFSKISLWIGRSERFKCPEKFVKLSTLCPDWKFIMVMPKTNQAVFEEIYHSSKELKNLTLIPGMEKSKLDNLYEKVAYLISTSEKEGFPNVILEAMKHGVPIVSGIDYDHMISGNMCGIVRQDMKKIAKFLHKQSQEEWRNMSINAYRFAQKNFDIRKQIKNYEEIFMKS